jgi:HSP20 family molecular chaperone IbpA
MSNSTNTLHISLNTFNPPNLWNGFVDTSPMDTLKSFDSSSTDAELQKDIMPNELCYVSYISKRETKHRLKIVQSESDVHYIYHILLPGLDKNNLDIEQVKEKNFLSIVITVTSVIYADSYEIKELLFPTKPLKIAKCLDEINLKEEILVSMDKGLLLIKIPKKYPIKRKKLKI